MMDAYVIGLDYGTDSVRAVLLNTTTGKEEATSVHFYKRWSTHAFAIPYKISSDSIPRIILRG